MLTRSLPASGVRGTGQEAPPHRAWYRVLDTTLAVESDAPEFLQLVDRDYVRFRVPGPLPDVRIACRVRLRRETPEPPFLEINGQRFFLNGHPNPVSLAYQRLVYTLFERLDAFVLLHAAVVERDEGAVILAGPPGSGKTTLALSLLESGYSLFSDDVCPLHRTTGLVHPFPRSVWVRVQAGRLGAAADPGSSRQGKERVDTRRLTGPAADRPRRATHLFYLDPCREAEGPGNFSLEIGLKEGCEASFLNGLKGVAPGVRVERLSGAASAWRITCPARKGLASSLRGFFRQERQAVWNVFRDDRVRPDFSRTPGCTPLAVHDAAFRLLGDLKQDVDVPEDTRGRVSGRRPGRLMIEVAGLLQGTACHSLSPGGLDARRDTVLALLRASRPGGSPARPRAWGPGPARRTPGP